MEPGIVYVLTNPAMPGLVKIGKTTRGSIEIRLPLLRVPSVQPAGGVARSRFPKGEGGARERAGNAPEPRIDQSVICQSQARRSWEGEG